MRQDQEVEITVDFGTHEVHERWSRDKEMFCPDCGKQEVWVEQSEGDFYVGPLFVCTSCESVWTIQGPGTATNVEQQRIASIREVSGGA